MEGLASVLTPELMSNAKRMLQDIALQAVGMSRDDAERHMESAQSYVRDMYAHPARAAMTVAEPLAKGALMVGGVFGTGWLLNAIPDMPAPHMKPFYDAAECGSDGIKTRLIDLLEARAYVCRRRSSVISRLARAGELVRRIMMLHAASLRDPAMRHNKGALPDTWRMYNAAMGAVSSYIHSLGHVFIADPDQVRRLPKGASGTQRLRRVPLEQAARTHHAAIAQELQTVLWDVRKAYDIFHTPESVKVSGRFWDSYATYVAEPGDGESNYKPRRLLWSDIQLGDCDEAQAAADLRALANPNRGVRTYGWSVRDAVHPQPSRGTNRGNRTTTIAGEYIDGYGGNVHGAAGYRGGSGCNGGGGNVCSDNDMDSDDNSDTENDGDGDDTCSDSDSDYD